MMASLRPIPPEEVDWELLGQQIDAANAQRDAWNAQRAGASPADLDPLEAAAAPIAPDEEMFRRQEARIKTDDYRRERALYRVAQRTGVPVQELMDRPEWAGVGEMRDGPVPMEARAMMAQTRMNEAAERQRRWQAQMTLSGGRPTGGPNGSKARIDALMQLTPEQQQEVIQAQFPQNRSLYDGDPRVAIAQMQNASEDRRQRNALEAQARQASDARAAAKEDREAERALQREQMDARYKEFDAKAQADRDKFWAELGLRTKDIESKDKAAQNSHDAQLLGLKAQLQGITNDGLRMQSSMDAQRDKLDASAKMAQPAIDAQMAAARQAMMDWADRHVSATYAEPQGAANYLTRSVRSFGVPLHDPTLFTPDEQEKAVAALLARYPHISPEEARSVIASVADTRSVE